MIFFFLSQNVFSNLLFSQLGFFLSLIQKIWVRNKSSTLPVSFTGIHVAMHAGNTHILKHRPLYKTAVLFNLKCLAQYILSKRLKTVL